MTGELKPAVAVVSTTMAAIAYAEQGIPVFPVHGVKAGVCTCQLGAKCANAGKHPATKNGVKDATTDVDQIRKVWKRYPQFNIGLATGHTFDVLDIDSTEAIGTLQSALMEKDGLVEATVLHEGNPPMVRTGNGWHVWYAPLGAGNRAAMVKGVDWRGLGGYVLAPPSNHASGRQYEWADWTDGLWSEPPEAPIPIRQLVKREGPWAVAGRPKQPTSLIDQLDSEMGTQIGLFRVLREAQEGERNTVLHWCACRVKDDLRAQVITKREASECLDGLTDVAKSIGLDDDEIRKTIESGMRSK